MPTAMLVRKLGFRVNKVAFNLNVFAPFSIAHNDAKRKCISSSGYTRTCCFQFSTLLFCCRNCHVVLKQLLRQCFQTFCWNCIGLSLWTINLYSLPVGTLVTGMNTCLVILFKMFFVLITRPKLCNTAENNNATLFTIISIPLRLG